MTKRTFEYSEIDTPNNRKAQAEMKVKQYMHRANDVKGLVKDLQSYASARNAIGESAGDGPPISDHIAWKAALAITQLAEENASMRAVTERQLAKKQCELDQLKARIKEADRAAKPYGMDEWKGGEKARASYIERITALEKEVEHWKLTAETLEEVRQAELESLEEIEKIATEQDRKLREQELRHQAELEKLREALGMFLFHPTAFNEAVENARRVLAVKDEWKPVAQTADEYLAANPGAEKKFWEEALQVQLDSVGESQWTNNIREALRTGQFPPKPI